MKGLVSGCICGDDEDDHAMKQSVIDGKCQLVYFTPEALLIGKRWRQLITSVTYRKRIKGLVIDEAHTLKKWYVLE